MQRSRKAHFLHMYRPPFWEHNILVLFTSFKFIQYTTCTYMVHRLIILYPICIIRSYFNVTGHKSL